MDVNALVAALFGAGGTGFLAAVWQVVRSYRSDKVVNEASLIERLDRRLKDAEQQRDEIAKEADRDRDRLTRERDGAREQAMRYRLLAIARGATQAELLEAGKLDG